MQSPCNWPDPDIWQPRMAAAAGVSAAVLYESTFFYTPLRTKITIMICKFSWVLYEQKQNMIPNGTIVLCCKGLRIRGRSSTKGAFAIN